MELERLQVVLEVESSAVNAQIESVKSQLAGIGSVAGTTSKAMTSSFGGLMNIFANMGIGSAMSKNIRNGMQAANSAVKTEMAKISTAMTTATAQAAQKNEATMKSMAQSMAASSREMATSMNSATTSATARNEASMKSMADNMREATSKLSEELASLSEKEFKVHLEADLNLDEVMEDIREIRVALEEALAKQGLLDVGLEDFEVANGPSTVIETPTQRNPSRRYDDDDILSLPSRSGSSSGTKSESSNIPAPSKSNTTSLTGEIIPRNGKVDTDDDVPAIRELKSAFESVRSELSKMVSNDAKSNGKDEDKTDNEAMKTMNSILKNIQEDTSAIRTRISSGIAGAAVPTAAGTAGKTVAAGAIGGGIGGGIGGMLKGIIMAAGIGYVVKDSIKTAMDGIESDSMFSSVFGKQASGMKQWSEGVGIGSQSMYNTGAQAGAKAPKDLGIDPVALRESTAYMFAMTKAMGVASGPAKQMSQDLSMLSNDMASFYNLSADEAFTKLRGGISGETEGLKALGVVVSENAVKQYAYSNGIARQGQELSESQKALSRYNIIMNSTSMAQGDLARTINSPANQLRVLQTNLQMVKRSLGEAFMPVVAVVLPILNSFMRGLNNVLKYVGAFMRILFGKPAGASGDGGAKAMAAGYDAVGNAAQGAGAKAEKAKGSLAGFDEINSLSMSSPSGGGAGGAVGGGGISMPEISDNGVFEDAAAAMDEYEAKVRAFLDRAKGWLPAIAGVAAGFAVLWTASHWTKIIGAVELLAGKFSLLSPILTPLITGMKAIGAAVSGLGAGPIALCVLAVVGLIAIITDLWRNSESFRSNIIAVWESVKGAFVNAWKMINDQGLRPLMEALKSLWTQFQGVYVNMRPIFEAVITVVARIAGNVVSTMALIIGAIVTLALKIVTFAADVITAFLKCINWVIDNWSGMWTKIGKFASDTWAAVKRTFNGVDQFFSDEFGAAWSAVKRIFSGVGDYFGGVWNTIKSKFTTIGSKIGDAVSGGFKGALNGTLATVERMINNFIRSINSAIRIVNKIPGVNISNVSELSIPRLAKGGIIDSPTVAMVGEAGREAVMPLENNTGWISQLAAQINNQGGGSDRPLELILQVGSTQLGRVVVDSLNKLSRQEGRLALNI